MGVPRRIGRYPIERELGRGGMGCVYEARDEELGRRIALKVLPANLAADPERFQRFRREARLLAAMNHSGIVTIYSVEEADRVPFLTMELIEGHTLEELIPESGLPLDRFFDVALPLADAVAAAHRRGVVHRDLKPSNVMCTLDGRVKVLDFGVAKLASGPASGDAKTDLITRDEMVVVGTLAYMSPEQISGAPVDARSDVFSLGVILFEMATGRRPFAGRTPAELLSAILAGRAPAADEIRPAVPRDLGLALARCLEREADDRMPTAADLADELRHVARAGQVLRSRSSPAAVTPSVAVLPFACLSVDQDDEFFADGVADEIINALGRLPNLKVAARTSAFSFKRTNEDSRRIGEKLGVGALLEGSVRRSGKRLRVSAQLVDGATGYHLWSERYDRELVDVFEIQEDIARCIASRLEATLIADSHQPIIHRGTADIEAFQSYTRGRGFLDQRTDTALWRAVGCFEQAIERDAGYALAWAGLADAFCLLEDYERADPGSLLPRAEHAATRALKLDGDLAEACASLALVHTIRHQGTQAIRDLERAIQIRPGYADAHNWMSWVALLLGRPDDALSSAQRAVELDPLSPEALSNLSLSWLANGNAAEAIRFGRRTQEVEPAFTSGRFYEALALYHLGRFDEARQKLTGLSIPWTGQGAQCTLAIVDAATGQTSRARATLGALLEANEHAGAALLHAALGEKAAAFERFQRVDRWDYWPALLIHHFFPDILDPLREDPRWQAILRSFQQEWEHHPAREPI